MRIRGFAAFAAAGALTASTLMGAPGLASSGQNGADQTLDLGSQKGPFVRASDEGVTAEAIAGSTSYWTADRMADAIPMDKKVGGESVSVATESRTQEAATHSKVAYKRIPKTVGKMFFRQGGLDYVCSAEVIYQKGSRPKKKNVISTAGHCIHQEGEGWAERIIFVPKYQNEFQHRQETGKPPRWGVWAGKDIITYRSWKRRQNYSRDMAFVKMRYNRNRNANIAEYVGGNRLKVGANRRQPFSRIVGYPAEPDNGQNYNGEYAYQCKGRVLAVRGRSDSAMACPMTGGASGGPWFRKMLSKNHGLVYATTSRRTIGSSPEYLLATPFPKSFRRMFNKF